MALVALLIAGGIAGSLYGVYRGYTHWRQARLLRQTREHLAKSDLRQATHAIKQAVQNNPNDPATCRTMAEVAERAGSSVAVFYRQRLLELEPNAVTNRFTLAKTALTFSEYAAADKALAAVPEAARASFDFHWMSALLCIPTHREPRAEEHLLAAMKLAPTNIVAPLKLAALRLQSADTNRHELARSLLLGLRNQPGAKLDALRMLTEDAARTARTSAALTLSAELFKSSEEFRDSLLRLQVVHRFQRAQYPELLVQLKARARENPIQAFELTQWLRGAGHADDAAQWLTVIPENVRRQLPLAPLVAGALEMKADWPALENFLTGQEWGRRDAIRHMFLARALRAREQGLAASVEWRKALKSAERNLVVLHELLEMTTAWNWEAETQEALWVVVNNWPNERDAFVALSSRLTKAGNTASLRTLFSRANQAAPENLAVKNNLVMTSLLLDARDKASHQKAFELYQTDPANPVLVSTYAFSLYLQNKAANALAAFAQLKPEQLLEPSVAAYYSLALAANGRAADAAKYLHAARTAKLLPEESTLLARAFPATRPVSTP